MKKNIALSCLIGVYIIGIIAAGVILVDSTRSHESNSQMQKFTSLTKLNKKDGIIGLVKIDSPISFITESPNVFISGQKGAGFWIDQLNTAATNEKIKAVIIRVNSPGGTVGASQELHAAVARIRAAGKPVITSVADLSASGGYYATVGSDYIFANAGSLVGSIGVILGGMEFSSLMQKLGIKYQAITSGKNKDILSPYKTMSDEQKVFLQKMVSNTYEQFLGAVADGRKKSKKELRPLADGSIFTGEQAFENGLIDAIGTFEDVIAYTKKTYKLENAHVELVSPSTQGFNLKDLISVAFSYKNTPEIKLSLKTHSLGYAPVLYLYTF